MSERNLTVRFINPAFLGNAAQEGQWRSPPFKALIRQWWRVVQSREVQYKPDALREEEGILFGYAGSNGARKSQLLIRMGHWGQGKLNEWSYPRGLQVQHPEVPRPVSADLYLGYGPVLPPSKKWGRPRVAIKNVAVKPNEPNELKLRFPDTPSIDQAIQLIQWFGTMGSRSRNGWGSLDIRDERIEPFGAAHPLLNLVSRDWHQCLDHEWPHAIGKDDRGLLIWHTEVLDSWEKVMQELARVKVSFRTRFSFKTGGRNGARAEDRHVLAYPVTNHEPREWENKRNANSIRFKVIKSDEGYQGRIFHLPCSLP